MDPGIMRGGDGMLGSDLFLSLAEIAGVFVGFGALIAVRSRGSMELSDVNNIRWVMTTGIWVVMSALAPSIIGSYGLSGHDLWLVCSVLALGLLAVMFVVFGWSPENRAEMEAELTTTPPMRTMLLAAPTIWLPLGGIVLALAAAALGVLPDLERALYLTAVALGLYMGAIGLFATVFIQRGWRARDATGATGSPAGKDVRARD